MSGRDTTGSPTARVAALRITGARFLSRWVLLALSAELLLGLLDRLTSNTTYLTTSYLVPVLALALVESGERTAAAGVVAFLLALLSGAWNHNLGSAAHLYRTALVGGGCGLAALGAMYRTRAVSVRDRYGLLARVGKIADEDQSLDDALRELAAVLVPAAADLCDLVLVAEGQARRAVRIPHHDDEPVAPLPSADALIEASRGEGRLIRRLNRAGDRGTAGQDGLALFAAGMRSAVLAPIRRRQETIALLLLAVGPSGRRYGLDDLRFAQTVGTRAALAIENARLVSELRDARQRLEAIVESLADAVTIRDISGRLIYANSAAMETMELAPGDDIGSYDPVALYDQYIVTDEHGDPLPMNELPSVKLLTGREPTPLVLRFVRESTGVEEWRVLKASPLYDAQHRLEAAVTIIEDITASKRAELRSELLARASAVLASSLDYEETLGKLAWLAVPEIADWCAVDLVDEEGRRQQVATAHRDPAKLEVARRLRELETDEPQLERGLGRVLRTGQPQLYPEIETALIDRLARSDEHLELMRQVGARSALVVPLRGSNQILGAMTLVTSESGRVFSEEDVNFVEQLAARAAVAVENARLYGERSRIASTLQQSLLPEALPHIDGWDVASLYRPARADDAVEVGGDFYDAFRIDAGWLMLIGDVTGKGVEAAAMTSLIRHGARFVAEYVLDPALVLARLDQALRQQTTLSLCTALCLLITEDRITFASAGHPLPLLITDDGVRTVGRSGPVLGAFDDGEWPTTEVTLHPNEVLLLYTDGVTDTVGRRNRFGEQRLRRTVAECGPGLPEELLECLDAALSRFQVGPQADDTAALALRPSGRPLASASGWRKHEAGH